MSENTALLGLPYLMASQAQKHVTHNEALRMLDGLVQLSVLSRNATSVPQQPEEGARYIVPDPVGDWSFPVGTVVAWQDGVWSEFPPQTGWVAYVEDEAALVVRMSDTWEAISAGGGAGADTLAQLGINTQADSATRLAVESDNIRFSHATEDMRLVLNKAQPDDTSSVVFQSGFVGHAEIGLVGDNNLALRVSPDGSTWKDALRVDQSSGAVTLPNTPSSGQMTAYLPAPMVRLALNGAGVPVLEPVTGRAIPINGTVRLIDPDNPPQLTLSSLQASTTHNVFARWSGSEVELVASSSGFHQDAATGLPVNENDPDELLVGMLRTDAAGGVVDDKTHRFVASYWHRRSRAMDARIDQIFTTTNTTGYDEITPELRLNFLSWGDEVSTFSSNLPLYNANSVAVVYVALINENSDLLATIFGNPAQQSYTFPTHLSLSQTFSPGHHRISPAFRVNGGTGGVFSNQTVVQAGIYGTVQI